MNSEVVFKNIHTIRRENMFRLFEQSGLSREEFAEKIGLSYPQLGHYIGKNPSKNVGDAVAKRIEEAFDLAPHYLDQDFGAPHGNKEPTLFTQIDENFKMAHIRFSKPDGRRPTIKIPVYRDVKAACGDGFENTLEDPSDHIEMEPVVLQMLGIDCKPENLRIIYSVEDSMWPTVPHDKPLFLDISDRDPNAIKTGKIYVFTHRYGCRMKRIFMGYDEDENKRNIRLTSDNPDKNEYPDEWITKEQLNEINFIGRLVWTGKEL